MKKLLACLMALCMLLCGASVAGADAAGDIVILYTNDVHCAVDETIGYAGLAAYRDELVAAGNQVALVDAGDAIQGAAIGTLSTGEYLVDIMNTLGYAAAVPGNHEFDYGMDRFLALAEKAEYPYVSANFTDLATGEPVLDAYTMVEFGDVKVAFVGICTPRTITSSTPAYFQNEAGEFIYGFQQDADGAALYACVQAAVDAAIAEGATYVIALAHLGVEIGCSPWMSTEVIANTTGIDALIDGHSHTTIEQEWVKNKAGEDVLHTQTGTKLEAIGQLTIAADGSMSSALVTGYEAKNADVEATIQAVQAQFTEMLETVVAKSDVDLIINDPATDVRVIRTAETNLGDLCADAYKAVSGADIAFVNGGGIRAKIAAGDVTYNDIISVHPYGNELCMVEATGQEILDALEMGARNIPDENGGFLQVAGLTYEIHTYVPSSVKLDDNGMFVSVDGEYRVKNVLVAGAPLEMDKTYTMSSHNYLIKNGGDGYTMFQDNTLVLEDVMIDNQVLITYITDSLGGVVGAQYAEPFGEGRIVAVPEAPAQ